MKKIIFLLIFIGSFAFSAIDECKTDVYFGNGILTSPDASKSNTELLRISIIEKFLVPIVSMGMHTPLQ